nr:VpsR-related response regulator [Acidithiobacillus montserratensis]MBU2747949.1 hypothetical protein [Acidithiobacillus montserratensis]
MPKKAALNVSEQSVERSVLYVGEKEIIASAVDVLKEEGWHILCVPSLAELPQFAIKTGALVGVVGFGEKEFVDHAHRVELMLAQSQMLK